MSGVDVIATSHTTSTFNMADGSLYKLDSLIATSTLKSKAGGQGMREKEFIMVVWCGKKIRSSGSLFGFTRQSLVMPNSDLWTDFSIRTSHLLFLHTG